MITVSSLQLIEDDLFTLRPSKKLSEPESPVRRSFNCSNSAFSAGLESTSLIKASMSAICFSVSSRRFPTDTGVVGPADVDVLETVVMLPVGENELLANLAVVVSLPLVLPSVVLLLVS